MAVTRTCNKCGHRQSIGYNDVDGRVKWWTSCEKCQRGNFMALPDQRVTDRLAEAHAQPRPTAGDGAEFASAACRLCGGEGRTLHHGSGDFAEMRDCSMCGSGETVANTTIPNVTAGPEPDFPARTPEQVAADEQARLDALGANSKPDPTTSKDLDL